MRKWAVYTEDGGQAVVVIDTSGKSGEISGLERYEFESALFTKGTDRGSYNVVSGSLVVLDDTDDSVIDSKKRKAIEIKKSWVDATVTEKQKELFEFDGTMFYPDERFANAILTAAPNRSDYSIDVKSAEKTGVCNKWVTMDKAMAVRFAIALLDRQKDIWEKGCKLLKNKLNTIYEDHNKTAENILRFDVPAEWLRLEE